MGKSCCAIDCKNRFKKQSELSFYRIPKAKDKRILIMQGLDNTHFAPF
uniref:THAP-type domain-containing protein n=1 Tax=Sphaeramia orbicularis TaxID=375764 RepID=A0A672YC78_9TELE